MLFLYLPLVVIVLYAFSASKIPGWPITNYSTHWFRLAWNDQFARDALVNSFSVGLRAAAIALVLGTCVAFALSRFRFFGQNAISLLFVLPIALPGIVTGMALLSAIEYLDIQPSLWTVVAGHATFCIVVVFNNAVARLRRTSTSFEEASMDLGADGWQTFRHVTLPNLVDRARGGRPARVRALVRRGRGDALHGRPASRRCRCGSTSSSGCRTPPRRPMRWRSS